MRHLGALHATKFSGPGLRVLPSLGSGGGIKGVIQGTLDVGISGRPLTDNELAKGVQAIVLGRTAVVLATSRSGVTDITIQRIKNALEWTEVRWPDGAPMRLVLRPADDADNQILTRYSAPVGAALSVALARPGVTIAQTDQDAADLLERVQGSLGLTTLALLRSEERKLNVLTLDGHQPVRAGQLNPDYPLTKELYLIVRAEPSAAVQSFLQVVRSNDGLAVLRRNGIVPHAHLSR